MCNHKQSENRYFFVGGGGGGFEVLIFGNSRV